jgi:hypothetical protein
MKWFDWLHQGEVALQYLLPLALAVALCEVSPWLIPVGLYVGWHVVEPIQFVINTLVGDLFYEDPEELYQKLEEADKAFWGKWYQGN